MIHPSGNTGIILLEKRLEQPSVRNQRCCIGDRIFHAYKPGDIVLSNQACADPVFHK